MKGGIRLWRDGGKKKNLEADSRIMRVILGGVKVRTSTFSFFPSVIDLADELLWLFQFGSITLYSTFLYHSVQFYVGKKAQNKKKRELFMIAVCDQTWQQVLFFWGGGGGVFISTAGSGSIAKCFGVSPVCSKKLWGRCFFYPPHQNELIWQWDYTLVPVCWLKVKQWRTWIS